MGSGTGVVPLPYEMFLLAERVPLVFHAHMISGAVVLLLAPLTIAMRRQPRVHRMLGRLVGAFVVVSGLTSFPVAILSDSALAARAGFFVQGLVWLALFAHGVAAIRRREAAIHARAMVAMYAVTTGAIWFRIMTGAAIALQLPFAPIYAAAAWLGWLLPLAIVLLWQRAARRIFVGEAHPSLRPA